MSLLSPTLRVCCIIEIIFLLTPLALAQMYLPGTYLGQSTLDGFTHELKVTIDDDGYTSIQSHVGDLAGMWIITQERVVLQGKPSPKALLMRFVGHMRENRYAGELVLCFCTQQQGICHQTIGSFVLDKVDTLAEP